MVKKDATSPVVTRRRAGKSDESESKIVSKSRSRSRGRPPGKKESVKKSPDSKPRSRSRSNSKPRSRSRGRPTKGSKTSSIPKSAPRQRSRSTSRSRQPLPIKVSPVPRQRKRTRSPIPLKKQPTGLMDDKFPVIKLPNVTMLSSSNSTSIIKSSSSVTKRVSAIVTPMTYSSPYSGRPQRAAASIATYKINGTAGNVKEGGEESVVIKTTTTTSSASNTTSNPSFVAKVEDTKSCSWLRLRVQDIPVVLFVFILICITTMVIMKYTVHGQWVYQKYLVDTWKQLASKPLFRVLNDGGGGTSGGSVKNN